MTVYIAPPTQDGLVLNSGDHLRVISGGIANDTTINEGGRELIRNGAIADNVTFGTPGGTLQLETPLGLEGTLSNWRVGDVVDLTRTSVFGLK